MISLLELSGNQWLRGAVSKIYSEFKVYGFVVKEIKLAKTVVLSFRLQLVHTLTTYT